MRWKLLFAVSLICNVGQLLQQLSSPPPEPTKIIRWEDLK